MFEYFNNTLCVHSAWLYSEGGIISKSNYNNLRGRGWLNTVRKGGNGRTALVEFDSIPERFKTKIVEIVGDPYSTTKNSTFAESIETDSKAVEFYNNYTLPDGSALPEKNKFEYIANASILNTVQKRVRQTKQVRGKVSRLWKKLPIFIHELPQHTFPHSLPKNSRSLQNKLKKYQAEGYAGLIHKGFCNDNGEKINDKAKVWILSRWADRVAKCANMSQLLFEYNEKAKKKGWQELKDENTLYKYLNKPSVKHLWYGHRYGDAASKEKYTYHHSTKLPTMRDSLWYSDGTKLNYFYLDSDGNVATCQVYEVMDAFSEVLLGFHVSKTENYEAQYKAYKMAVQVAGHRPYQIGFDGQGGHKKLKSGNFLTNLARLAIKTAPYNGKSKTIESAFGRFQMQFLKRDWFFTGQNITAKKQESKANREFINANIKNLPTLEEVIEIYKKRREEWNNAPHPATGEPRVAMYRASNNPQAPEIGIWDMIDLFWIQREKAVTCSAFGISFTENKSKHTYTVTTSDQLPDVNWLRENVDKKFIIKYDPEDMTMIHLYEKDALGLRFVTEARTKVEVFRGKQEQEAWETDFLAKVKQLNEESRLNADEQMDEVLEEHGMLPEQYGLNSPAPLGLKGKRKKVFNDLGRITKRESNETPLTDEDMDRLEVVTIDSTPIQEEAETNIYKRISKTRR